MALNIEFSQKPSANSEVLIVPVNEDKKFTLPGTIALKPETLAFMQHAITSRPGFKGKAGETLSVPLPAGEAFKSVVFAGFQTAMLDRASSLNTLEAGGKLYPALDKEWSKAVTFAVTSEFLAGDLDRDSAIASAMQGIDLASYKFDRYKVKETGPDTPVKLEAINVVGASAAAEKAFAPLKAETQGVALTRDLANMPPNDLYPESFADIIKKELEPLGVEVEVLAYKDLLTHKAGGIAGVGQGSDRKPCMVTMRWKGKGAKNVKPAGFVGKGVTFDTGGISIKPAAGMEDMKMDMHGAATVVGLMKTLALRGAPLDVVATVGLAENMPSGNALRPSDVITMMDQKTTVEVLNTDAEGRLVLADCLYHIQKQDPDFIVDLATLTGAMVVALGSEYTGVFANDDKLWQEIEAASKFTGEKAWRMPLDQAWRDQIKSKTATIQNMGQKGRDAGACIAAAFLEHFVNKGRRWAHMDIAGTGMGKDGGTGVAVRMLNRMLQNTYEI